MSGPSRSELSSLIPSVQFSALVNPHFIKSGPVCDHRENLSDPCECSLEYYCPLCCLEIVAENVFGMETHYHEVHWNERIDMGKYTVFPCGLMHTSARVSLSGSHGAPTSTLHYHCPYCPGMTTHFKTSEILQQHVQVAHTSRHNTNSERAIICNSEWSFSDYSRTIETETGRGDKGLRKIGFRDVVNIREFPLGASIVEQAGGRSESKRQKTSFDAYVETSLVENFAACDLEIWGCDYKAMKLFKSCTFLVCGTEIPHSVFAGITSLGGTVSGANYIESGEWDRITHILLGNRISLKSVRNLRKNVPETLASSIMWVGIDWVKKCIESGKIFGTRKIFTVGAIERFFSVRDANLRAERRKSLRIRPDIFTSSSLHVPDIQPVHVVPSPRLSPTVSFSTMNSDDNSMMPSMTPSMTPEYSPVVPVLIPSVSIGDPNVLDAPSHDTSVLSSMNHSVVDQSNLRRSKRLSVIGASQAAKSLSMIYPIRKKHI